MQYREQTQAEGERRKWEFEELEASTVLLQRLVDGDWDAVDCLVIPPGRTPRPTYDEDIVGLA